MFAQIVPAAADEVQSKAEPPNALATASLKELMGDHLTLFADVVPAMTVNGGDIAIPYRDTSSNEINYRKEHIDAHVAVTLEGMGYWPQKNWIACWVKTPLGEAFIAPKTLGVGNDCGGPKIAAETPAVSGQPTPSWEKRTRTDEMTHKTYSSVIRDFPFADGIVIRTLVMCGDIGANVVFAAFRANNPTPFSMDKDGNSAIRVSLDGGSVHVARGEGLASGKPAQFVQIVFFAPAAIEKMERNTLPNTGGLLGGLSDKIGKTMGNAAVAVVAGWAAGTLTEFASARSVRVELRLADGTADIVDLNPQDTALNQIVTSCVSHFRSSAMNTERRRD